jgi:hypothetical protein
MAVPIVFLLAGFAGVRMAFNVPAEPAASWIFQTATHPARAGLRAARLSALALIGVLPALCAAGLYAWFWSPSIAVPLGATVLALAWTITEMSLRSLDFVPFTRRYNPERGNLKTRWPLFLIVGVLFLQFVPWLIRALLGAGTLWILPGLLAVTALALALTHPPEPPALVDTDHEDKPLALRLY